MSEVISAGLLMYYKNCDDLKLFLIHPGGPFFTKKDAGYWGIPKGLPDEGENLLEAAKREFYEETGRIPSGEFVPLGNVVQKGGKRVYAWAFSCDNADKIEIFCNSFQMEWPPKSGRKQSFPEVDKGEFFSVEEAKAKINSAQAEFIDRLIEHLKN